MENATPSGNMPEKRLEGKLWAAFIVAVFLLVGFLVWTLYLSPEAKYFHQTKENIKQYEKGMAEYEARMKGDTYGGKTPQETLDMFTDAVKKDDLELASKYFVVDLKTDWLKTLQGAKQEGKLLKILTIISGKFEIENVTDKSKLFNFRDEKGIVLTTINFTLNKYSNVWKIESL